MQSLGRDNPVDLFLPTPDDVSTICFTSGTTGEGVLMVQLVQLII